MPMMTEFVGSVTDINTDKGPLGNGLNGKARDDFCYLVAQSGLTSKLFVDHVLLSGTNGLPDTECVVVGVDKKNPVATIPASALTFKESPRLVVVAYADGNVSGVYVWTVDDTVLKPKLFSMFKIDKKTGDLIIKAKNLEKCADNKFGVVYKDYIFKGAI